MEPAPAAAVEPAPAAAVGPDVITVTPPGGRCWGPPLGAAAAGALALVPPRVSRATTPSAAMDAAYLVGDELQQHIAHIAQVEDFSLVPSVSTLLPTAGVSSEEKSAWGSWFGRVSRTLRPDASFSAGAALASLAARITEYTALRLHHYNLFKEMRHKKEFRKERRSAKNATMKMTFAILELYKEQMQWRYA